MLAQRLGLLKRPVIAAPCECWPFFLGGGGGGIAPVLDFSTRWRWDSVTAQMLSVHISDEAAHDDEEKNVHAHQESNILSSCCK